MLCILFGLFLSFKIEAQKQPNIILFIVDDMGMTDAINPKFHTPNIDLLTKQGVKFTNAYATPVCTPTRTSILTGMNAAHHGVTNWTSPNKNNNRITPFLVLLSFIELIITFIFFSLFPFF